MRLYGQKHWKARNPLQIRSFRTKYLGSSYASIRNTSPPTYRIQRLRRFFTKKRNYFQKQQHQKNNKEQNMIPPEEEKENSYYRHYQQLMKQIHSSGNNFFSSDTEEQIIERENNWLRLSIVGKGLVEYFSWAIPTNQILEIFPYFSPIIEMGAGKGYWAYLLKQKYGLDGKIKIRSFDWSPNYHHSWTIVEKGTPGSIFPRQDIQQANPPYQTLFLSYPDEDNELGLECLSYFEGNYLLHIGELITTGSYARYPQSSFGRTTAASFQLELMEKFHCIAIIPLPRYPFCNDYLTIWKRTEWVLGKGLYVKHVLQSSSPSSPDQPANQLVEAVSSTTSSESKESEESEQRDVSNQEDEDEDEEQKLDYWANIPVEERFSIEWICPAYQFLKK